MKVSRLQLGQSALYLFIIFGLSYLVATRELKVGTDAVNYYQYFLNIGFFHGSQYQHEPGFHYFALLIHKLTTNYMVFLFAFNVLINFIYIKGMGNFIDKRNKTLCILAHTIFIGLFLSSSWYQVATLNGLRQGISLVCLYLSLSYLFLDKKLKFISFLLVSLSFHSSTFLIMPFLILYRFGLRVSLILFSILALFYPLGINELVVKVFSDLTGITVYTLILNYAENFELWRGFQLPFFLYSMFWCVLFSFVHLKFFKDSLLSEFLLRTLLILTCAYFVFGFGGFSNRFGFFSWLFLPIIQAFYLANFTAYYVKNKNLVFIIAVFSVLHGFYNYYYVLRPVI